MNTPPDFSPMTTTAKQKVLDHYLALEAEARALHRLDALPKSERAAELRDVLLEIAQVRP